MKSELTNDHLALEDTRAARRYFSGLARILGHLEDVLAGSGAGGIPQELEKALLQGYLQALSASIEALGHKYMMAGRVSSLLPEALTIDSVDSGFPVHAELLHMASDAQQLDQHLGSLPPPDEIRKQMIRHILNELSVPLKLQYAMSQRLYYQRLAAGGLYWARNDPQIVWLGSDGDDDRRSYLLHWATYDSQVNIPVIWMMLLEDSGRTALPRDGNRWPQAQSQLMAQSLLALKLVTVASGFDQDFDHLHPKLMRRIRVGPLYAHGYTRQRGPLAEILAESRSAEDQAWALAWSAETLRSDRVERERKGFFGSVEREIYKLDHFDRQAGDSGASAVQRALILPQRPYQVLEERSPPGLAGVRKYVVGENGQILSYR